MPRTTRRAAAEEASSAEAEAIEVDGDDDELGNASVDPEPPAKLVVDDEKADEIWTAVREEYHETVEQLPLAFQRLFVLIKELEGHSQEYDAEMTELIQAYIERRREYASHCYHDPQPEGVKQEEPASTMDSIETTLLPPVIDGMTDGNGLARSSASSPLSSAHSPLPATEPTNPSSAASSPPSPPPPPILTNPLLSPSTLPSEIISRIAVLSSLSLTAADERLNAAEAAQAALDRHIALIDQTIKDQETALVNGTRPGTHPGAVVLPAVVPPKARQREREREPEKPSIKIRLPAAQTHEEIYCYCAQPSYGEMVACDNEESCPRQWFHFSCVGLKSAPKGKWFCRDCKTAQVRARGKRRGY